MSETIKKDRDNMRAHADRVGDPWLRKLVNDADRLAAYERDLECDGQDKSQDTDCLRAAFLQSNREIERMESERDDHEQARTALEEELAQTKAELREYQKNTIKRDESVPKAADEWHRWIDDDGSKVSWWMRDGLRMSDAPDLRPDTEGPITLPIVAVDTP